MFQSQHPLLKTLFPEGNLRRSMRRRPATVLYTFQDHHHRHHNGILIVNRHHDPHFHPHHGSGGHPVQNLHWCSYQQSRLEDLPLREVYQAQREQAVKVACYLLLSHLHWFHFQGVWYDPCAASDPLPRVSHPDFRQIVSCRWLSVCPGKLQVVLIPSYTTITKKGRLPLQCVLESCSFCNHKSDICCLCLHLCL